MNDIRHLALLAVVIGLSGYNVKTAAQTPFDKVEVEKRIEKLLTPQIKKMPRSQATAKVTDCRMNTHTHTINVTMDKGFADFSFDRKLVRNIKKAFAKELPKTYRKYDINIFTCGNDIKTLAEDADRTTRDYLWKGIDYQGEPWVRNVSSPVQPSHGLYNRHLAVWASHGLYYDTDKTTWKWQRPRLFCTTEDLFTPTIVNTYLMPMLENAGAVVFTPRERDLQTNEVIIDNDDTRAGVSYIEVDGSRKWETTRDKAFARQAGRTYHNGENPFEDGTARMCRTTRRNKNYSLISYQPTLPEEGRYAVYVSYQSLPKSIDDAHYTIWHKGEKTELRVNQKMGGGTWVYLGTFDFDKGSSEFNRVVLTNQSHAKGIVTADAVRFGGGMGNIERGGSVSGLPRCLEGARYNAQWAGFPTSVYNGREGSNDYADDINTRSNATNLLGGGSCFMPYRNGKNVPIELSLAIHSDAGFSADDNDIIGSLAICTTNHNGGLLDAGVPRTASRQLATALINNINNDLNAIYGKWNVRGVWDKNYSETRLPGVPSAILETLSHQNFNDMRLAQDPNFRFSLARSIYKTVARFVSSSHGTPYVIAPLTPMNFRIEHIGNNEVELQWDAQEDPLEPSAHPNGYIVYTAYGQGDYDNGTYVHSATHYRFRTEPGVLYSFRVEAVNRGGKSFPTPTLCARISPGAKKNILVVDGFHRLASPSYHCNSTEQGFDFNDDPGIAMGSHFGWVGKQTDFDRSKMGKEGVGGLGWSDDCMTGICIAGNEFNYVRTHAEAIAASGDYNILSCMDQAIERGKHGLDGYQLVDIAFGLERNDGYSIIPYKTLTEELRNRLMRYTSKGGALLVSGAYIGTDIDTEGERHFAREVLKWSMKGTYRTDNDTLTGLNTAFTFHHALNNRHYAATSADVLQAEGKAFTAMRYADGQPACVAYKGDYRCLTMGFPFECIKESTKRKSVMKALVRFLTD